MPPTRAQQRRRVLQVLAARDIPVQLYEREPAPNRYEIVLVTRSLIVTLGDIIPGDTLEFIARQITGMDVSEFFAAPSKR